MSLSKLQDSEKIVKDIDALVVELEKLRLAYEQYFLGFERVEPQKLRETVVGLIRKYSSAAIKNTAARFRFQQTVARYNVYTTYWDRVLREIEEGRYQRDVFRAKIHETARREPASSAPKKDSPRDMVAELFETYVAARKAAKEGVDGLTLEKFRKTVVTQVEVIRKKTGAPGVHFRVVTEGGKAKIKAIPRVEKKPPP